MTRVQAKCGAIVEIDYFSKFEAGSEAWLHQTRCPSPKDGTCQHLEESQGMDRKKFWRCPAVVLGPVEVKEDAK